MSDVHYAETLRRIMGAELPPATERFAVRLLAKANPDCGHINLTWGELEELTGIVNRGAARRHLTRMKQARIAHYDTNDYVYVTFFAWTDAPAPARGRADGRVDAPECEDDPIVEAGHEEPTEAFRRAHAPAPARGRAENDGGKEGWVGMGDLDPNSGDQEISQPIPTQPPPTAAELAALRPDHRWAYNLLIDEDLDIEPANAFACIRWHTAGYVLKQVAAWWMEEDKRGVGLLVWRLMNPGKHRPGPISASFLDSDLYRRHYDRAWELAGNEVSTTDPPRWVLDLPAPPEMVEYDAGGVTIRILDDAAERQRKYGGAT